MRDIGQSQEKKCHGCDEVEGVVRSRFYECLCWKGMIQLEREGRKCFLCYWRKANQIVLVVGRWCSCKKVWPFGNAIDAEFEEQRTTKKADLWAVDRGVHAHAHTDNQGILESRRPGWRGLHRSIIEVCGLKKHGVAHRWVRDAWRGQL